MAKKPHLSTEDVDAIFNGINLISAALDEPPMDSQEELTLRETCALSEESRETCGDSRAELLRKQIRSKLFPNQVKN